MGDRTVQVIRAMAEKELTLAVAESLTGGALTAELTRPAGASLVVLGGVVVYATELKHTLADVDLKLLDEHGPVHPDVAAQLAEGVRRRLAVDGRSADIGISATGVAGPDPQGGEEPGTVFIGVATASGTKVVPLHLGGTRGEIRNQVVGRAVAAVAEALGLADRDDEESA
jgi:nicotinamide-nucleotide amidase